VVCFSPNKQDENKIIIKGKYSLRSMYDPEIIWMLQRRLVTKTRILLKIITPTLKEFIANVSLMLPASSVTLIVQLL
jgi:hypothetical protein